jgi:hypothetical protein
MDILKKVFPFAFNAKKNDVASLVIAILIFLVIGIVGGFVIGLCAHIPVVNILCGIAGGLLDLYAVGGIVLSVLSFCEVLK